MICMQVPTKSSSYLLKERVSEGVVETHLNAACL